MAESLYDIPSESKETPPVKKSESLYDIPEATDYSEQMYTLPMDVGEPFPTRKGFIDYVKDIMIAGQKDVPYTTPPTMISEAKDVLPSQAMMGRPESYTPYGLPTAITPETTGASTFDTMRVVNNVLSVIGKSDVGQKVRGITTLRRDRGVELVAPPLKRGDISQAVTDALMGNQYEGVVDATRRFFVTPQTQALYEDFLRRHPVLRFADRAEKGLTDFYISMLADSLIAGTFFKKYPNWKVMPAQQVEALAKEESEKALTDIKGIFKRIGFKRFDEAVAELADDPKYVEMFHEAYWTPEINLPVIGDEFGRALQKEYLEQLVKDGKLTQKKLDDLIEYSTYGRLEYLRTTPIKYGAKLERGAIEAWAEKPIKQVLEAEPSLSVDVGGKTGGKILKEKGVQIVGGAIPPTNKLDMMTQTELDELVSVVESINSIGAGVEAKALQKVRLPMKFYRAVSGLFNKAERRLTGPPMHIFNRLGLLTEWTNVAKGINDASIAYRMGINWKNGMIKEFNEAFKPTRQWSDVINQVMGYIANGETDIPKELLSKFKAEVKDSDKALRWLDNQADFMNKALFESIADEAEYLGLLTSDPLKSKMLGIPPRIKGRYYHWMHENVIKYYQELNEEIAEEAKGMKLEKAATSTLFPTGDIQSAKKLIPKGLPAGTFAPEFLARKTTDPSQISHDFSTVFDISWKRSTQKVYQEPEWKELSQIIKNLPGTRIDEDIIKAMPDGTAKTKAIVSNAQAEMRDEAYYYVTQWMKRTRGMPLKMPDPDKKLVESTNQVFNEATRFMRWGTKLGNFAPAFQQLTQSSLNFDIFGSKSTLWGYKSILTQSGRELAATSNAKLMRDIPMSALSEFDITSEAGTKAWLQKWYKRTSKGLDTASYFDMSVIDKAINVSSSYNSAVFYLLDNVPKYRKELYDYAYKFHGLLPGQLKGETFTKITTEAIRNGHLQEVRKLSDHVGINYTQFAYDRFNMPAHLMWGRGAGKFFGLYTHFGTYMGGAHYPQMIHQLIEGTDVFGNKLPFLSERRQALMLYLIRMGTVNVLAKKYLNANLDFLMPYGNVPTGYIMGTRVFAPVNPIINLINSVGNAGLATLEEDPKQANRYWKSAIEQMAAIVPGGVGVTKATKVISGEKPPHSMIMRVPPEKKKQPSDWGSKWGKELEKEGWAPKSEW